MKPIFRILSLVFSVLVFTANAVEAQVSVKLTITNQEIIGDNLFFDIFLNTTPDNSGGDLYMADSDFVIDFNSAAFTNPSISKVEDPDLTVVQYGYVSLLPTIVTGTVLDDLFRFNIYNSTSPTVAISGTEIIVNFQGASPSSTTALNQNVARIDAQEYTHRLGRFRISGISNQNVDLNLGWDTSNLVPTAVFSYDAVTLLASEAVTCFKVDSIPFNPPVPDTVKACLHLANPTLYEDSLFFDVFVQTATDNNGGNLFLADAALSLSFNSEAFTNPSISKIENPNLGNLQYGYVSLLPSVANGPIEEDLFRLGVFTGTDVGIAADNAHFTINYDPSIPQSSTELAEEIARIDGQPFTHRLGRFLITGATDPNFDFQLDWETGGVFASSLGHYDSLSLVYSPVELCYQTDTLQVIPSDPDPPSPVEVCLSVENQLEKEGGLEFDVYLHTAPGNEGGDLYLAQSRFVLDYNPLSFQLPAISRVEDPSQTDPQFGYVTLLPEVISGGQAEDIFRESVYNQTSAAENTPQGSVIIEFSGSVPQSSDALEQEVPFIDEQQNTHRLGRFRISGLLSSAVDPGLNWNVDGPADSTEVFSYRPETLEAEKAELCLLVVPYEPTDTIPEIPQVKACVVLANQQLDSARTGVLFDIFVHTSPDSQGDLYLADSDFVIAFDTSNFENPVFTRVEDSSLSPLQYGYVSLLPSVVSGTIVDDIFRLNIFNNTATQIGFNGHDLIVNFFGAGPFDQQSYENNVPRIDEQEFTHRLGRFHVSGLKDPTADFGLNWNIVGPIETVLFSYASQDFNAYEVDLCTEVIPYSDTSNTDPTGNLEFEFITFQGQHQISGVNQLDYSVKNEFEIFYYNITRSKNGIDFELIGNIPAVGGGPDTIAYDFQDLNPRAGNNYYRIEAVTFGGELFYSHIIEILIDREGSAIVYPQPAVNELNINYFSDSDQILKIDLIDVLGRIVISEEYPLLLGENEIEIDIRRFATATYFLRMRAENETDTITEKVILMNP